MERRSPPSDRGGERLSGNHRIFVHGGRDVERRVAEFLPPEDVGRFEVTNTAGDKYVFKSPSLRNIVLTPPYVHSGRVWSLSDAVTIMGSAQLGISLSEQEAARITAFMHSLTGDQPRVEHPILPPNSASTPRPALMVPSN